MADNNELAEKRTDWAESRTDLAEDRTILANERTFAAWIRTGLTSVVVALALRAVFQPFEPTWVPKLVAEMFILGGIIVFIAARQQTCDTIGRLDEHHAKAQSLRYLTSLCTLLALASAATGVILWLL